MIIIGEHGDYTWNEKEQHLYPRKYFMEQACGAMAKSGRAVPIFNDKHVETHSPDPKGAGNLNPLTLFGSVSLVPLCQPTGPPRVQPLPFKFFNLSRVLGCP